MGQLENFPLLDQLSELNVNNKIDVNSEFDCVATSIAAGMRYLVGGSWTGADLKDAVYGASYTGPTAASRYTDYCAQNGVEIHEIDNPDNNELIDIIKSQIDKRHPVLATEQDPYANPSLGWSHVICFYAYDEAANTLTVMDPWGAQSITKSADEWASVMEFASVFAMFKEGDRLMGGIPKGWKDNGKELQPEGCPFEVKLGFRDYILSHDWNSGNWPLENEAGLEQVEISNPGLGHGTRQRFRMTTLEWTKEKGVFVGWSGQELIALEQHLINLVTTNAELRAKLQPQKTVLSAETQQVLTELVKAAQSLL